MHQVLRVDIDHPLAGAAPHAEELPVTAVIVERLETFEAHAPRERMRNDSASVTR